MDINNNNQPGQQINPNVSNTQPAGMPVEPKKNNKMMLVVAVVAILLIVGMGAYILLSNNQAANNDQQQITDSIDQGAVSAVQESIQGPAENAPTNYPEAIFNLDDPEEDLADIEKELNSL